MREIGIYIHIPFCKQKCYYCDFISYPQKAKLAKRYIKALKTEIKEKSKQEKDVEISTIYIGGGTPSYINENYIKDILEEIRKNFNIKKDAEITIEANPGTVNEEKLKIYKVAGINRLSIGMQAVQNHILKQIGRIHTYKEFEETYNLAKKVGFKNINVDIMLALPNQTIEELKETLEKVIKLNPNHISVYSLIIEENTKIEEILEKEEIRLPDEETERQMYWYAKNTLELNGYTHYEISNFAKKGCESKHNMDCWEQKEYLGFGIAAHSYIGNKRFSNIENLDEYIENLEQFEKTDNKNYLENNKIIHEEETIEEMMKEYMLLGLRKIEGVKISKFKEKFVHNPIYLYREELNKLVNEDLVEVDIDNIRLTNKGVDLANQVWQEFV